MSSYFRNLPSFEYVSRLPDAKIGDYIEVKNLFKRGSIRPDIFQNVAFFEKYKIIGDERPDNVAYKVYEDSKFDWVVLLCNNIINIQTEWPLTQESFDTYLREKYGRGYTTEEEIYNNIYNGVHHYETIEIKNSQGVTILPAGKIVEEYIQLPKPLDKQDKNKIDSLFYDSDVVIDSSTASGKVVYQLDNSDISVSDEYGNFIVNELDSSWTYTLTQFDLVFDKKIVSDTMSYISKDGVKRIIKVKATANDDYSISLSVEKTVGSISYFEYYDYASNSIILETDVTVPVTNYEYEEKLENEKRNIYVLKPRYLNIILNDVANMMQYKEGSSQYKTETLKRADNIRLYQ